MDRVVDGAGRFYQKKMQSLYNLVISITTEIWWEIKEHTPCTLKKYIIWHASCIGCFKIGDKMLLIYSSRNNPSAGVNVSYCIISDGSQSEAEIQQTIQTKAASGSLCSTFEYATFSIFRRKTSKSSST